jgi:hypothetical protein
MSKILPTPIPENVLAFLQKRLVRQVRKAVLDKIVAEKLAEVEQELRARLQPEVEQLTIDMIRVADDILNRRFQLLVAWNHTITKTEDIGTL